MAGLKFVFIIGLLSVSCEAFWWGRSDSNSNQVSQTPTAAPPLRQYPISYIRAFAYHPVAFPQPLAPITTYHVSKNPQQSPSRSFPPPQAFTQQQLPNSQVPQDFGPPPAPSTTTTTTTTTTTPPPPVTQSTFSSSQPFPQSYSRGDFSHQRQLPFQNYGGFPYYYNQQYHYRYDDAPPQQNQFSGRLYNSDQPQFQQYSVDPVTYQFIPTSITPLAQPQNSVKFVPCMCPVAVQVSAPLIEKRNDEIPILQPTTESSPVSQAAPTQEVEEEVESK